MHADTTEQWSGSLRLLHADMPLNKPCGSWLASDGGESVLTSGKDIAPSRGKLAPTNAAITLWELACQRWRCVSHFIRQGHCAIARQARSYKCRYHPVGAGLPAMAVCQSLHPAMTLRHREASSLPQMPLTPCGSWLASDGGVSVISSGKDIAPSRGKLAPTNAAITLWELACQRWRCVSYFIRQGHCAIARQARPHKCRYHPVGAGLPAMAVCQSYIRRGHCTIARRARSYKCRLHPVGAGLPAMAVCQSFHPAMTLRHREASSLLQMPLTPCGSWLASDGGVSVISSGIDIAPSRGKLAPTNAAYTLWELACQR